MRIPLHLFVYACFHGGDDAERELDRRTPRTVREEKRVDGRFDVVDQCFKEVDTRFDAVDQRFDAVDQRFKEIDQRFEAVDRRFEEVDRRFDEVNRRLDKVDRRFELLEAKMEAGFQTMATRWDRMTGILVVGLLGLIGTQL